MTLSGLEALTLALAVIAAGSGAVAWLSIRGQIRKINGASDRRNCEDRRGFGFGR